MEERGRGGKIRGFFSSLKTQAHWPEQGDGKDAGDEEERVEDEHPGQGDLSWRHAATGRRAGPPCSSLTKLYRRDYRRCRHHHHHYWIEASSVHVNEQKVHDLLIPKVKLTASKHHYDDATGGDEGADDLVAGENKKIQAHYQDVDGNDDGGHGGGPEHGLGSKGL